MTSLCWMNQASIRLWHHPAMRIWTRERSFTLTVLATLVAC